MNLEQQVCSLEYAEKLKELGVEQKSLFHWVRRSEHYMERTLVEPSEPTLEMGGPPYDFPYESVGSAFTVAELGEILPQSIPEKDAWLKIMPFEDAGWGIEYFVYKKDGSQPSLCFENDKNEADARAKMLIYLIENHLYDPQTQKT